MAIPFMGWAGVVLLALLFLAVIIAQPIRILLTGKVCRSLGVPPDKLAEWALEDARKERPNPVVEIFAAVRGKHQSYAERTPTSVNPEPPPRPRQIE